jgi:hypothetical protein
MIAGSGATEVGPRDHVVQFFRRDEELAKTIGVYLAGAIRDGGTAVVIATRAHQRAFEERLAIAGVDAEAAQARGDYLIADADRMLRQFMTGGRPDAGCFERAARSLIEEPVRRGGTVRVYGELVGVLWEAGLVTAAIELEEMWIGLGRWLPFTLCCGYRTAAGTDDRLAGALAAVCRLHGAVIGQVPAGYPRSGELGRKFAESLDSVGQARRFVVAALEASGYGAAANDGALVVTELAANAVVHARSAFAVTITFGEESVRISVGDHAALAGPANGHAFPAEPLHGLGAVAAMAMRWGVAPTRSGKDVWVELRR